MQNKKQIGAYIDPKLYKRVKAKRKKELEETGRYRSLNSIVVDLFNKWVKNKVKI
jgi:hypothetical protein